MLSGVRIVARESVAGSGASKNAENSRGDADDPEMLAKRKDAGLEWMSVAQKRSAAPVEAPQAEAPEEPRVNPKELNPHWRDGGEGYPAAETIPRPTAGVVGDGGASWLRKGLKRAQEQAAREGKDINDVVEDRWGSYNHLTAAIGGRRGAHANAHLHATRDRKRRLENGEEERKVGDEKEDESREFGSRNRSQMRAPRLDGSFKWGRESSKKARSEDSFGEVPKAGPVFANDGSFLEKFREMEGSKGGVQQRVFDPVDERRSSEKKAGVQQRFDPVDERRSSEKKAGVQQRSDPADERRSSAKKARVQQRFDPVDERRSSEKKAGVQQRVFDPVDERRSSEKKAGVQQRVFDPVDVSSEKKAGSSRPDDDDEKLERDDSSERREARGGESTSEAGDAPVDNQVAAKAMRLKLMGKIKEADELLMQHKQQAAEAPASKDQRRSGDETLMKRITGRQRHTEENRDFDSVLASKIYRNKERFNADDEYDDVGIQTEKQRTRAAKKNDARARKTTVSQYNRIQTQVERCQFCFENPSRPKHLTVAIGNFTYLMLPSTSPLVPGHCYIVPSQHEGSTRNVDDDVWEEIRNFKKCLLKMFKEQEKEVIFMETVMGLSQQKRHCIVECIPVPPAVLKQGPLYFKKAIDEAEEEWSQHNAKKLIDTRIKGLRSSIPKNFPYFHVEFGLEGGYCHIIDDESSFKSNFGRNVLIGMLKLPQETMHQKSRHESFEHQRTAVKQFSDLWKPHDWTTMLE